MALERELAYFEGQLLELLKHNKGQFAVIKDETLLGTYTTFNEAFEAGVNEWGTAPFLIREVTDKPPRADFPDLTLGLQHPDT